MLVVLTTFLSPLGNRQSSIFSSLVLPPLKNFLEVMVLEVSWPSLLVQTELVLIVWPSLMPLSSPSSTINRSRSLVQRLWKKGRKSSSRREGRVPKKSSKMLCARMGAMVPNMMLSQFWRLNSEERALQASFTSTNFLFASSLPGLFLGWYWRASFLQAVLISSRVAFLLRPSVLQQLVSGLGQWVSKNFSSFSSAKPCSLKKRSKVEVASAREYSRLRISSQWARLLWSERMSKASEISLNLASAVLRCSLCLSGCHFAASLWQAFSISKRVAPWATPSTLQQFFTEGLGFIRKICFYDYKSGRIMGIYTRYYSRFLSKLCYEIQHSIHSTHLSCKCPTGAAPNFLAEGTEEKKAIWIDWFCMIFNIFQSPWPFTMGGCLELAKYYSNLALPELQLMRVPGCRAWT